MTTKPLHPLGWAQMQREHAAWVAACRELKKEGIDINEAEAIHASLVLWGEELAHLRMTQERETWDKASEYARELYNKHIGFLPF